MSPDIEKVTALIAEAAEAEILPRFARLAKHEIREKQPGDLVTVADEATEARLAPRLLELVPGSVVVGEEAAAADPELLRHLSAVAPLWVIDPIDGTANFARGAPGFVVMVAFIRGDRVQAGWIHDPVGRRTAVGEAGAGAWLEGKRLRVAVAPADPAELIGTLHAGFYGQPELAKRLQARRGRVRALKSLRCAGLEYLRLACGEMHFSLFTKLMAWDHAPGVLIHGEAGGHAAYLEGGAYEPARTDASGLLLAPDRESWEALRERLFGP